MKDSPADLLTKAQAGDANAAAELWRAIDAGKVDDATAAAWARNVATQVVAKVINPDIPSNRRAENARAALGLEGRLEANPELRRFREENLDCSVRDLAKFADLIVDVRGKDQGQVYRQLVHIDKKRQSKDK